MENDYISPKKTKIIILNKSGKMIRLKIRISELTIESCSHYTYLGTVFTPNNNVKKAQRAQISTIRKLLSTLVSPILLYNSEI